MIPLLSLSCDLSYIGIAYRGSNSWKMALIFVSLRQFTLSVFVCFSSEQCGISKLAFQFFVQSQYFSELLYHSGHNVNWNGWKKTNKGKVCHNIKFLPFSSKTAHDCQQRHRRIGLFVICYLGSIIYTKGAIYPKYHDLLVCWRLGRATVLGSFQCLGVLLLWVIVGQEPAVLAEGVSMDLIAINLTALRKYL